VPELSDVSSEEQQADIAADGTPEPEAEAAAAPAPAPAAAEPRVRRLNIIGLRNIFFAISLLIIIPGIVSMATRHFALGIDFAGGTEVTVNFANHPDLVRVQGVVDGENLNGTVIQTGGGYILRYPVLNQVQLTNVENDLTSHLGPMTVQQTLFYSLLAGVLASVAILLLLAIRFRNVPGGWRAGFQFGGSALAALLHDVFILTGIFSILGKVFDLRIGEIDAFFVTAVLTVVGFSVHDTIVVFDRIRENLRVSQRLSFEQVVNLSIMQTAARSIITSFTVVLVLAAIFISGGETIKGLALALLIGIISGTYSSIFNAAPLLVVWRRLQPVR